MYRHICLALVLCFVLSNSIEIYAETDTINESLKNISIEEAVEDANKELKAVYNVENYYIKEKVTDVNAPDYLKQGLNSKIYDDFKALVYGTHHGKPYSGGKRYFGYNKKGESIPNYDYPYDAIPDRSFDKMNWVEDPWRDKRVYGDSRYDKTQRTEFDKDEYREALLPRFREAMGDQHEPYFDNDPTVPWEKYMHVVLPPTKYTYGIIRMWNIKDSGALYYIDVYLKPTFNSEITLHVNHFDTDGNPLSGFNYSETITEGGRTLEPRYVSNYKAVGYKVDYDVVPTGSIETFEESIDIEVESEHENVYVEWYYEKIVEYTEDEIHYEDLNPLAVGKCSF